MFTSSITLDNSTISNGVYAKLLGDFNVLSGSYLTYADTAIPYESTVSSKLGGDFYEGGNAIAKYKSSITDEIIITKIKPLDPDETYKWVTELVIN